MKLIEKIERELDQDYAIVIDGPDYIAINEHESFNPASTIKLYILYAGLVAMETKKIHKDDTIEIKAKEIVPGAGVIQYLSARKYTLDDLLTLMIAYSDNTATNVMLDVLSIDYIQSIVESLGLKETFVRRKLYHMIPGVFNASSASDLNIILHHIYEGIGISKDLSDYGKEIMKKQQYKNIGAKLLTCARCKKIISDNTCTCGLYIGDVDPIMVPVYSKSGEITGHVHDACIIDIQGQPIYVTILTSRQKNNLETKEKLGKIGLMIYNHYKEVLC
ncbi:serine hydrolase [Acidaminobacter sp. JC074]|uniref:serine hydrolase n=1 Tax=Acidaminobacter sp. JC074 TaxID=2530199 RepID=UPI001F0F4ED0|nr:serine hydrolase [Acidaminobacter sp. JC074]MCH4887460.1 serine hydrolase [Acidaminobacter sp. JC074]